MILTPEQTVFVTPSDNKALASAEMIEIGNRFDGFQLQTTLGTIIG